MSSHAGSRGRRRGPQSHAEEHENDERWLLTYADMITLLMALFMVLFSISSVNKSKFVTLQRALKEAFSGKVLPGGRSIAQAGSNPSNATPAPESPFPEVSPNLTGPTSETSGATQRTAVENARAVQAAVNAETAEFAKLKAQIDSYAKAHGLASKIQTSITRRGLLIRLLTDKVAFDSGSADLKAPAKPLLNRIATLIRAEAQDRPVQVDGHTDNVPIHGGQYSDNWTLSTARATSVVRYFIGDGLSPSRLGAGGFAYYHPVASNSTADGRARNRRVEILLQRLTVPPGGASSP